MAACAVLLAAGALLQAAFPDPGALARFLGGHRRLAALLDLLGIGRMPRGGVLPALLALLCYALASCTVRRARRLPGGGTRAAWASVAFHASLLLVAAGGLGSALGRYEARAVLTEGELLREGAAGLSVTRRPLLPVGLPGGFRFRLVRVVPRPGAGPVRLVRRRHTQAVRPFHPADLDGVRVYGLEHGFAPSFTVRDDLGRVRFSAFVALRSAAAGGTVRSGHRDAFRPPGLPFTVGVTLPATGGDAPPDRARVTVSRDGAVLFSGVLRPGRPVRLPGATLSMGGVRRWSAFRLVRDPGMPLVYVGFIVGLGALAARAYLAPPPGRDRCPGRIQHRA